MRAIVVYKSKTGFTKRYAEWIADELTCDMADYEYVSNASFAEYDLIIYGSRVHAGKVDGLKNIKTLLVNNANIVVFATGGTPLAAEDAVNTIWKASLSEEELVKIPHFYMPGGLNYERMGVVDRLIMKTLSKMLNSKKEKSSDEIGCEQAIGSSYDISSREYILPLVQFVQGKK